MVTHTSIRAHWAQDLVRLQVTAELNKLLSNGAGESGDSPISLLPSTPFSNDPHNLPEDSRFYAPGKPKKEGTLPEDAKVCIVGAGAAGLYLAMLLDSIDVRYDIVEASNRTGGRMYTHNFSKEPHDYYDIGAMRYPNIPTMKRTFDLFKQLNIPLIEYFYDGKKVFNVPSRFNDVTAISNSTPPRPEQRKENDIYGVGIAKGGSVPDSTLQKGVDNILEEAFGPYKKELMVNWKEGFKCLMDVDKYSTRQYLREKVDGGYDFYSIQWMETQDTSSNLFDEAFSESVIDSFDFDPPPPGENGPKPPIPGGHRWYCILGGTSILANAMKSSIVGKIEFSKRVNKIWRDRAKDEDANMYVQCAGESEPRWPYVTVFNTTSLGCLQRMDLTGLELHPSAKDAIRCLHYDNSCKVAIKFKYPWWIEDCGITSGGVASTDLPLRTCVYPSYNLQDKGSAVLLCSYTWAQDAVRAGSLISRNSPEGEDELKELMFDNLAKLHLKNFVGKSLHEAREIISKAYDTHHAWAWTHDPYMSGAFALFGPGQFSNFYTFLTRPAADAKFHIVGEASSAHHAWIVGALDSAMAACLKFLGRYQLWEKKEMLKERWRDVAELDDDIDGTAHLQEILGRLPKENQVQVKPVADLYKHYFGT